MKETCQESSFQDPKDHIIKRWTHSILTGEGGAEGAVNVLTTDLLNGCQWSDNVSLPIELAKQNLVEKAYDTVGQTVTRSVMHSESKHLTERIDQRQIRLLEKIAKEEKIDRSAALSKDLGYRDKEVYEEEGGRGLQKGKNIRWEGG